MRKTLLLFVFFTLMGGSIYYSLSNIKFEENISGILPANSENKFLIELLDSAAIFDRIIFHVYLTDSNSSGPDALVTTANMLIDSIRARFIPQYISSIEGRTDPMLQYSTLETFFNYLPLYMEKEDYQRIDSLIDNGDFEQMLGEQMKLLNTPAGMMTARFMFRDPLNLVPLQLKRLHDLQVDTNLTVYSNYLLTTDKKHLLFFISPTESKNTGENSEFIAQLDKVISHVEASNNHKVKTEYIGSVPISAANATQIKSDIILTLSISIVLIILLNYYFFRRKRNLILILLPPFFGAVMALVFFAITKQKVSLIALGIGSVTLGLSIDYSLHILTHLKHSRNIRESAKNVGIPLMICSVTTVVAFLCLLLLSSPAIRQFAIFSAISVFSAALLAIFFIPFVVTPGTKEFSAKSITFIEKLASVETGYHILRIGSILLLTVIFFFFSKKVTFEKDLEKSNFMSEKLSVASKNLDNATDLNRKKIYLMSKGENLDIALKNSEKNIESLTLLKKDNRINTFNGIHSLVFSTSLQQIKINKWESFWTYEKKEKLKSSLNKAASIHHIKKGAFNKFYELLDNNFRPIDPKILLDEFSFIAGNFIINLSDQTLLATVIRIDTKDQKDAILQAFKSNTAAYILDRKDFFTHVFQSIKIDFNRLIGYSSIFGTLMILAFFGRIEIAFITFLPIFISWVWTLGLLGLSGYPLNFFNIVICNLIFGLGIDYSTFITKGLTQRYALGNDDFKSHKSSIIISLLTTLIGLGILILAKHPALRSIAILAIIGLLSSVFVSFVIQPSLFKIITEANGRKLKNPVQFTNLLFSILIFGFFGIMVLITIIILPLIFIMPLNKPKKQYIMRWLVGKTFWVMIRTHWKVDNKRIGFTSGLFKTPSIIISNHQSMVDIMTYLSLSPNILMMTKDWVWKSPIFGLIVRACGHISISGGYEKSISVIEKKIQEGNSILVFPEGSRTRDGNIGRFHKGGFYIAQQLNLPISKFLVHGIGNILAPKSFIINKGCITIKYLGSLNIQNNDPRAYYYASHSMCQELRQAYSELCNEIETPYYLRHQLIANYIYKGPVIENYIKVKARLENYYELFDRLIPRKASITDIGCGYGAMSLMLCMRSKGRNILGIDYDENKIMLAANCELSSRSSIKFIASDATKYNFSASDVFLISDMLHYLSPVKQLSLVNGCIERLNPGGMIIIRDGDSQLKTKHFRTLLTEFFSTHLGFNKTTSKLSFFSSNFVENIAAEYKMNLEIIDDSKLTSNRIYILKK